MTSVRFPEMPQEDTTNYLFDHAVVVARFDKSNIFKTPRCIAIDTTNNDIYVVEEIGYIYVFSETGTFKHSYCLEHMERVWGIAIHGDRVYLTDVKLDAVFCYKIGIGEFHLVARLGKRGCGMGQFRCPCQLAISTNRDVYIADKYNSRVQILDSSLHPIKKHASLFHPIDVKLTEHEVYVASLFTSLCVHVFSYSGEKIRSVITNDSKIYGDAFYLSANKNIIISESLAHRIQFFSNEGVHLHTLDILGQHDKVRPTLHWHQRMSYEPTGIALISEEKLVITTKENSGSIQMYSFNK